MASDKRRTDIFIATPMYGGMCYGTFTESFARLALVFQQAGVSSRYSFQFNNALITKARNDLAAEFMKTNSTHLMFIDADIGFSAEDILTMMQADKDIICGLYPRKSIEWRQVEEAVGNGIKAPDLHKYSGTFPVNTIGNENITDVLNQSNIKPIEVKNAGTGFMLIKREVLEALENKVPKYFVEEDGFITDKEYSQYFDTTIDTEDNIFLSEDFYFCKLARDNGFKVWVAPWVELTHTGTHTYTGRPY